MRKTLDAFCMPNAKGMAIIDLHGYCGASAFAAMEDIQYFSETMSTFNYPSNMYQ